MQTDVKDDSTDGVTDGLTDLCIDGVTDCIVTDRTDKHRHAQTRDSGRRAQTCTGG